jgi:hypothetical protein
VEEAFAEAAIQDEPLGPLPLTRAQAQVTRLALQNLAWTVRHEDRQLADIRAALAAVEDCLEESPEPIPQPA